MDHATTTQPMQCSTFDEVKEPKDSKSEESAATIIWPRDCLYSTYSTPRRLDFMRQQWRQEFMIKEKIPFQFISSQTFINWHQKAKESSRVASLLLCDQPYVTNFIDAKGTSQRSLFPQKDEDMDPNSYYNLCIKLSSKWTSLPESIKTLQAIFYHQYLAEIIFILTKALPENLKFDEAELPNDLSDLFKSAETMHAAQKDILERCNANFFGEYDSRWKEDKKWLEIWITKTYPHVMYNQMLICSKRKTLLNEADEYFQDEIKFWFDKIPG